MAQGQRITVEEGERIMQLIEAKMRPPYIALKIGRTKNAVYAWLKKNNVKVSSKKRSDPVMMAMECENFSSLPDTVLFNPKMFPSF